MINSHLGFDIEEVKKQLKEVKYLINTIIRCKKILNYQTDTDEAFKQELKKIKAK